MMYNIHFGSNKRKFFAELKVNYQLIDNTNLNTACLKCESTADQREYLYVVADRDWKRSLYLPKAPFFTIYSMTAL
jgi:hypothetical protein